MIQRPLPSVRSSLLAASLSALMLAAPAHAEVVLDTFGPGDSAVGGNWSLQNLEQALGGGQWLAVPFTLASAAIVDDILTSIVGSGSFQLGIVAGAGLPSGAFAYSTTLTNPDANTLLGGLGWALQAGEYWLVSRADVGAQGAWQGGGPNVYSRPWAFTLNAADDANWAYTSDFDAPAARINVSAIPEPGTWALMFGGLLIVGALAKRRAG